MWEPLLGAVYGCERELRLANSPSSRQVTRLCMKKLHMAPWSVTSEHGTVGLGSPLCAMR